MSSRPSFAIVGKLSAAKSDLIQSLKEAGYVVSRIVKPSLTYIVIPSKGTPPSAPTMQKARQLGLRTTSERVVRTMLSNRKAPRAAPSRSPSRAKSHTSTHQATTSSAATHAPSPSMTKLMRGRAFWHWNMYRIAWGRAWEYVDALYKATDGGKLKDSIRAAEDIMYGLNDLPRPSIEVVGNEEMAADVVGKQLRSDLHEAIHADKERLNPYDLTRPENVEHVLYWLNVALQHQIKTRDVVYKFARGSVKELDPWINATKKEIQEFNSYRKLLHDMERRRA